MEDFLIERELLEGIANKLREYLNFGTHRIDRDLAPSMIDKIVAVEPGSIPILYYEFVNDPLMGQDDELGDPNEGQYDGDVAAYTYLPDNDGSYRPVLLLGYPIDINQVYFYEGTDYIEGVDDGQMYDMWRRIDLFDPTYGEGDEYTDYNIYSWDSSTRRVFYTLPIVNTVEDVLTINPANFVDKIEEAVKTGGLVISSGSGGEDISEHLQEQEVLVNDILNLLSNFE